MLAGAGVTYAELLTRARVVAPHWSRLAATHATAAVAAAGLYRPPAHAVQLKAPVVSVLYELAAHGMQAVAPAPGEKKPAAHDVQAEAPVVTKL